MRIIRAFIGIDFSRELKNEIYKRQQIMKSYAHRGRWKYIDNFHLTLKFLGETTSAQREQINEIMKSICANEKPFCLQIKGVGTFPGRDSVRVLWLGLAGDIAPLQSLHQKIDTALAPIGFQPEKRSYRPHITIGQNIVFKRSTAQILEQMKDLQLGRVEVSSLFLFKSEQINNKRVYTKVQEYPLGEWQ